MEAAAHLILNFLLMIMSFSVSVLIAEWFDTGRVYSDTFTVATASIAAVFLFRLGGAL